MIGTPLIERREFFLALNRHIESEKNGEMTLGLVLINFSNLSAINHSMSFEHGDVAIKESYSRLLSISKLPQTVFRIGGHHFVFILPALANPAFMALATNKIMRLLSGGISYGDDIIDGDIQLGVAIDIDRKLDAQGYLILAEQSLTKSKGGLPHIQLRHVEGKNLVTQDQHILKQQFKEALQSNSFELYYQPKVNLRTGHVDKAEVLLRWKSAELGFVSPEVIVDLAEQHGESYTLTKWVLHTAIRQLNRWQTTMGIGVAVNIQASLIAEPDLLRLVSDALAIWGGDIDKLTLEITESAVIEDKESGLENLEHLRERGVTLSIDDFGTGYSSLSYFKDIPAHELKIDKAFVMNMLSNQQDQDIVKIIIEIAHVFNLKVVAEGIEDEETLNHLISLGCDYGQGYFIAGPLPVDEFEAWFSHYPGLPARSNKE
ncbi:MAG: bifunctional diguanylate cyclase/phosphodiesterase [Pseudomonadales bacterium]